MRPTWDEYFMRVAYAASERATCPRRKVGAIVVKDKRISSTGYNGSLPGAKHCIDVGCKIHEGHCIRTIHAEANAIDYATSRELRDATIYTTSFPCISCAHKILRTGIIEVVWDTPYSKWHKPVQELMNSEGVVIRSLYARRSMYTRNQLHESSFSQIDP